MVSFSDLGFISEYLLGSTMKYGNINKVLSTVLTTHDNNDDPCWKLCLSSYELLFMLLLFHLENLKDLVKIVLSAVFTAHTLCLFTVLTFPG